MDPIQKTMLLIDRLARLGAAEIWAHDLNPSQAAALVYLGRANRFSRSPSHVADYLASTRGTVSQTLKALVRKGLLTENRSASDRRSISYQLTADGARMAAAFGHFATGARLDEARLETLNGDLSAILNDVLSARGMRSFGLCQSCLHHEARGEGGYCRLLKLALEPAELTQICHEHAA